MSQSSEDSDHDEERQEETQDDNDFRDLPVRELYMRKYELHLKKDEEPEMSEIHGTKITRLPGHLFFTDYGNSCIKLLDRNFSVVTRYDSLFQPWDVAILDDTFFVVTFPFVRLMQKFKMKNATEIFPWFPVKSQNEYFAVCADRDRIIATCKYDGQNLTDRPSVHVMDHQGNIELILDKDADGKRLFVDPDYLTLDESLQTVYVSDTGNKTIVAFNVKGDILARFMSEMFEPRGITFDKNNGYIFVYDIVRESVFKLDQHLKPLELIKPKGDPLCGVLSVLFCARTDKIMLTTNNSNIIKVFIV